MVTLASIIQICNVPPKRLIHLIIFILISFKFNQTERPYLKRCWTRQTDHRYPGTVAVRKHSIEDCKNYCENELRHCSLIVFDEISKPNLCFVKNTSSPLNASNFQYSSKIHSHVLDLECSKNVSSCWTVKGDYTFPDLLQFEAPHMTVKACKDHCINVYPDCDLIALINNMKFGLYCYVKTDAGSLNHFSPSLGSKLYVLNRTCLTSDLDFNECWTTQTNQSYSNTSATVKLSIRDCKNVCEKELRRCNLVVYDDSSTINNICFFKNTILPINNSLFVTSPGVHSHVLDLECSKNVSSCWTVKGDFTFPDLVKFEASHMTVQVCKNHCIKDHPDCDLIALINNVQNGLTCYIKNDTKPLDQFRSLPGSKLYILQRSCLSSAISLFGKYYILFLLVALEFDFWSAHC